MAKENREYKDSVLVDLFCEDENAKENQIALYNALYGTNYTIDNVNISDIRIKDTIYMNLRNDMAFDIDERVLILSEHQSTINNNMPLRSLMNIGRTYEKLVPVRNRYRKALVKIPKPEFYVLYNGTEHMENEKVLRLSDAYKENNEKFGANILNNLDNNDESSLELTVRVININLEANGEILQKCPILMEYAQFVSCVRKHKGMNEENAMENAIRECIANGVLKDYLLRRGSEVANMLCAEYDYNLDMEVQREESYEKGLAEGIIIALGEKGNVSDKLKSVIATQDNIDILKEWIKLVVKVSTVEEFVKEANLQ